MYLRKTNKKDEVIKMGERTQMLIRLHDHTGEVKFSTILHYQWGFGRVMPMDALNLIIQMPSSYRLNLKHGVLGRGCEKAWFDWFGAKSHGSNYWDDKQYKQFAYHATEEDLWGSDNDDGFMIMDWYANYENDNDFERVTLAFYNYDRNFDNRLMTFNQYCKATDDNRYTDGDFRRGFKCMLRTYGIELIEPNKEKE